MNFEDATAAILEEFATAWVNTTPVAWPNIPFDPPENASWVRVTVLHAEARQVSLGSAKVYRRPGVVIVQVFVPEATAGQPALALADQVVTALQGKQLTGGVQLQTASIREVGPDQRGAYQINVSVPFTYSEQP